MKLLLPFLGLWIIICSNPNRTHAFEYYESSEINYWGTEKKKEKKTKKPAKKISERKNQKKKSFSWKKTLNPKNEEFFREGNYVPPQAFMEVARNPNDENIKNWFKLIEKKNMLSKRLYERMQEYLRKNNKLKPREKELLSKQINTLPQAKDDYKNYRFRMYFESNCSHCKRMMTTMKELQDMGYFVELKQIDRNTRKTKALPFPISFASKKELQEKRINAWPVLFIANLKKKIIYRLNGYQSTSQVLQSFNKQ